LGDGVGCLELMGSYRKAIVVVMMQQEEEGRREGG